MQPPLLLMKARPGPGLSFTNTLFAIDGPLFFTTMLNVIGPVVGSVDGPVLVIARSAFGVTVVVTADELLPATGSGVALDTDAVFVIGPLAVVATV